MYTISKKFSFSASHQLLQLEDGHPCKRLHGHNYEIEFVLQAEELDENGFICDYKSLSFIKDYIDNTFDHRHLNDIMGNIYTTAENIAKWFYDWAVALLPQLVAVRVSETPKTWAEYGMTR